jgi:hypothetical protein
MITDITIEDRLVQQTFAEHLEKVLGWEKPLCLQHVKRCRVRHRQFLHDDS